MAPRSREPWTLGAEKWLPRKTLCCAQPPCIRINCNFHTKPVMLACVAHRTSFPARGPRVSLACLCIPQPCRGLRGKRRAACLPQMLKNRGAHRNWEILGCLISNPDLPLSWATFVPISGTAKVLLVLVEGENPKKSDKLKACRWMKQEFLSIRQVMEGSALRLSCINFPKCIYSC